MSIELMDEHERGERVRRWLKDNGNAIFGGVAVGLLAFFGWQWHQNSQLQARYDAANQFESLRKAIEADEAETITEVAAGIGGTFKESPYVALAELQVAQTKLEAGDLDAASAALDKARSSAKEPLLAQLAALRLARLRVAQGQLDEALALADASKADFPGLASELRGDILKAQGKSEEAISAYQDALTHLDANQPSRGLVELKLTDLGATAPQES
ncbi:MAG: YfgM family protein [Lysobacterales bacterium]|jgi:predicted negative regulator of RcsB-dependent stress response